jgi:hypothetical protein
MKFCTLPFQTLIPARDESFEKPPRPPELPIQWFWIVSCFGEDAVVGETPTVTDAVLEPSALEAVSL